MKAERNFAPAEAVGRVDLYFEAHRGIRMSGARLMAQLGALDPSDVAAIRQAERALEDHLTMAESHATLENFYIHAALEERTPGASKHLAEDHDHHLEAFAELRRLMGRVVREAPGGLDAARKLYRTFARYHGEDLVHMHQEETGLMPVLWKHFSDAELLEIRQKIVAAVAPATKVIYTRAMLAAASEAERVARVTALKTQLRRWQFESLMEGVVGRRWTFGNWRQLATAIG